MDLHDDEDVLELALDVGDEGEGARLLEDDGDDVVADVALPRQLLAVVRGEGQEGGDVEHELVAHVVRVHAVQAGGVVWEGKKKVNNQLITHGLLSRSINQDAVRKIDVFFLILQLLYC